MSERVSRDELYLNIAQCFAMRSTCNRGQVGCCLTVNDHLVGGGYNGAPPGMPHCLDVGCDMQLVNKAVQPPEPDLWVEVGGCRRATHAEANAVAFAARHGTPCVDGTLYCTHACCATCAALVVAAGIVRVVYLKPYRLTAGVELLDRANVKVEHYGLE